MLRSDAGQPLMRLGVHGLKKVPRTQQNALEEATATTFWPEAVHTTVTPDSPPSTVWTLWKDGWRVEYVACLLPVGVEIMIMSDGQMLYSRTFSTSEDALAFAEDERQQRV